MRMSFDGEEGIEGILFGDFTQQITPKHKLRLNRSSNH